MYRRPPRPNRTDTLCPSATLFRSGLKNDIRGRGIEAGKVTVVPNAVDTERFTTERRVDAALQRSLGLEGCIVLGFIGSFYAYEGLKLLMEAMVRLFRERQGVKLLVVGGGAVQERLVAQVDRLGIGEQVVFTGRVPPAKVSRSIGPVAFFVT